MTVWIADEENHGFVCLARTREIAIQHLIKTGWITSRTEFFNNKNNKWEEVENILGKNWKKALEKQDDDFFDGSFYFTEHDVVE